MILTKRFKFDAAHRIPGHPKCGRIHGHTYGVEVSIEVPKDQFYDFAEFKATIQPFIDLLDHSYLNEWFGSRVPTAENIALWLWLVLEAETELPLVEIKVFETENSWVTYRG